MLAVVKRSVTRTLSDMSAADETVQDVMFEIWMKADDCAAIDSPMAWASVVARRRAIDRGRADRSRKLREELVQGRRPVQIELVAEEVIIRLDRERVVAALDVVSDKQREAIVLAFFGDQPYYEVARQLGVPLGTVKRRIRDGMKLMRPLL